MAKRRTGPGGWPLGVCRQCGADIDRAFTICPVCQGDDAGDAWDCDEQGHEWQLLTRHVDPPGQEGALSNAVCVHCSEHTWIDVSDDD